jgi:hypothetical protein
MRNKNLRPLAIVACFCSFIQLFWCAAASAHDSFPSNTTTSDPDPGSTSGTAGCFTAGVPLLVNTTSGIVLGGHIEPSVVAWRGIPYAEPPLGRLRFEPPQPLARPRAHILDARRYGPACFQFAYNTVLSAPIPREQQSEDCLTVNVFRSFDVGAQDPAQRSALNGTTASSGPGGGGLPVLVWVHGGGFAEGSSSGMSSSTLLMCVDEINQADDGGRLIRTEVQFTPSEFVRNHPEILVATFKYIFFVSHFSFETFFILHRLFFRFTPAIRALSGPQVYLLCQIQVLRSIHVVLHCRYFRGTPSFPAAKHVAQLPPEHLRLPPLARHR